MKKILDLLLKIGFLVFNFLFYLTKKQVKKDTFQITKNVKFKIRPNTIDPFVIFDNFYLKEYLKESDIKSSDIVVDIGAHIGSFSIFSSQYAKKVISYEASPINYKLFVENIRLNSIKNIDAENTAIYSKKCKINFFHDEGNTGGNSLYLKCQKQKSYIKAIPLSQIFIDNKINRIDFLKMDVEGAEYEILLNTPKKYLDKINKIALEYHDYFWSANTSGICTRMKRAKTYSLEAQASRYHGRKPVVVHFSTEHNVQELIRFFKKNGFEVKTIACPIISQIYQSGLLKAFRT